ncbi:hypothetical protein ACPT9H_17940 [Brevibacillus borstelensis]|uniref:hypothetical protein n=1 Tax=Brevibacillus borstelensis TaxID=45462 RepID=UPI003CE59CF1
MAETIIKNLSVTYQFNSDPKPTIATKIVSKDSKTYLKLEMKFPASFFDGSWPRYFTSIQGITAYGLVLNSTIRRETAIETVIDNSNRTMYVYALLSRSDVGKNITGLVETETVNITSQRLWRYQATYDSGLYAQPFSMADSTSITIESTWFNQPPTLTLTSPSNNQTLTEGQAIYTGNNDFTIRLTADDADPSDTLEYQIRLNGVIKRDWTPIARNTPVDYTFLKADYTKDRNSFTVTVRDSQGGQTVFNGSLDKVQGLPVNVVSSAYLVSRMSPPVRLNNGWLVACLIDNGIAISGESWMRMYVSKNDGRTWEAKGRWGYTTGSYTLLNSLVTNGQYVYFVFAPTVNSTIRLQRFDPVANTFLDSAAVVVLDSIVQTTINSVTLAITPDKTKLWWAASTKNSTYPNSFNIRTGSIPINADGTLGTPSAVRQGTSLNTSTAHYYNPTLLIRNGNPIVIWEYSQSGAYGFGGQYYPGSGTSWTTINFTGSNYTGIYKLSFPQTNPSAAVSVDGVIHLAWQGADGGDAVTQWIRYTRSADGGVSWLTEPKKLVKGTNASVTSDRNGKVFITYEDGGYIKRIESTDEFATFTGPVIVEQGSNPTSLYDPIFSTPFSVPPTIYQTSSAVRYYGILNQQPTVTLTTADGQMLTEGATLQVEGSAMEFDVDNNVLVKYRINSGPTRNLASGVSDGVTPLSFARVLTYRNKRIWDGAADVVGIDLAENTDHVLKVWAEDDQGGKSDEITRQFRVSHNNPPAMTVDAFTPVHPGLIPPDLITLSGTVSDPDGNTVTVTGKVNNGAPQTLLSGVSGGNWSFSFPVSALQEGGNTITITATDQFGSSTVKTFNVNNAITKTPLDKGVARYKVTPPLGAAKEILAWMQREIGDLSVDGAASFVDAGQSEQYMTMAKSSVDLAHGIAEDEFVASVADPKADIVFKQTFTRMNTDSSESALKLVGVIE